MKIPTFFSPSSSIAVRLTWRVVGTLFLILLIITAVFLALMWFVGIFIISNLYWLKMDATAEKINNLFTSVEVVLKNNVPEVENSINKEGGEYDAVLHLLNLNPNYVGAAVALDPAQEPKKGQQYAPYAFRDSTGIKTKMLTSKEYDYVNQAWFSKPMKTGKSEWTEPYVDKGGGEILMTTCSRPLVNDKGEVYGVQTADLSLGWLTKLAQEVDSTNNEDFYFGIDSDRKGNSRSCIITSNGAFIVHPDKIEANDETIYTFFSQVKDKEKGQKLIEEILSGNQGKSSFIDKSNRRYGIFYVPVKHTGWTIATLVPTSDLFAPVNVFVEIMIIGLLATLLLIALICRRDIHKIIRPLSLFASSADEISKGNLATPLPNIKTKDEMYMLHNSFSTMQQSLINQIEEIKKANEEKGRIEGELLIARNIQMSMIPKTFPAFPDRTDVDVFALMNPAKEVGGDLYDFLVKNEKLYFCIGDVSGKGIPAAMVMAVTRALFRTSTSHDSHPGKIVSGINEMIVDDNDSSMFVTLFVGVLDLPTGRLRYSNAGHNPPLLIKSSSVEPLPCDANLPLGIMENWKYTTQETIIDYQTMIFLYTDGLTEAEDIHFNQFEEERIIEVAKQSTDNPKTLIEQMENVVNQFTGDAEQNDDMTMLAIQYTKQQQSYTLFNRSINLKNDIEQVPLLAAFVEEVCEEAGLDMGTSMSMNLAIEEAVVNVMNYAYPPGTVGDIDIQAMANDVQMKFIITDSGKPFDPTTKEDIDTTLPAEERLIGGLGIHLVKQIMDSINYERTDGKNVLTLRKKLN